MKTVRILAAAFFLAFVILTAIGIYMISTSLSSYTIIYSLPEGFIRDSAEYLLGLFQPVF